LNTTVQKRGICLNCSQAAEHSVSLKMQGDYEHVSAWSVQVDSSQDFLFIRLIDMFLKECFLSVTFSSVLNDTTFGVNESR